MIIDENPKIDNAQQPNNNNDKDSEVVLSVKGVSKKFCRDLKRSLFYGVQDIASDLTGLRTKSDKLRKKEFWALDKVSFELKRGEALGLVGKNGSGKSTLLRIIAGLIKPDLGTVEITGRVAPLIALGAGFNPILTGRENIYANMAILGLSKQEIDERFDDVVEFAEIGDAIDAPVQTYSSGMAARLGFACAIHTEPDILVIDEVLAVGDVKFRGKCYRKLEQLRKSQTSIVLVNHNPEGIYSVCDSACYLRQGNLLASGNVDLVMSRYEHDLFLADKNINKKLGCMTIPKKNELESQGLDITSVFFRDDNNIIIDAPITGSNVLFCLECYAHRDLNNICLKIAICANTHEVLFLNNLHDGELINVQKGKNELQVHMPYLGLQPGLYTMKIGLLLGSLYLLDAIQSFNFKVLNHQTNKNLSRCQYNQQRNWKVI